MPRRDALVALIVAVAMPIGTLELARSSASSGKSLAYTTELTAIGPRVTGSPSYQQAAEWAVDHFRAMGLARVALEPFTN